MSRSLRWRRLRLLLTLSGTLGLFMALGASQAGGRTTPTASVTFSNAGCTITATYTWTGFSQGTGAYVTISDSSRNTTQVGPTKDLGDSGSASVTLVLTPTSTLQTIVATGQLTKGNGNLVKDTLASNFESEACN